MAIMRVAGDPAQVKSLIKSIKDFKNFKNMAQYNISCLLSHITPPTVGWRENILTAVESGGIESIIDILKQFPKDLEMIKSAIDGLSGLTTNSSNAAIVAKSGGVEAALNAMLGLTKEQAATPDGEEVAEAGSKLLEKVAQYNPNAIIDSPSGIDAVLDGLMHSDNQRVKQACATVADRVGASDRGQKEILKKGGIEALIKSIEPPSENTEEMLKPTFRLLEKFADDKANVKKMRELGGVEALVHQLESHADNEQLLRIGGRLLAKVAADDIESAIERLKRGGLTDKAREFTTALLANLALQPENIDKIVAQGGVKVLIENFDQFNDKTQIAAARALARVAAANKENADAIIAQGGVQVLMNAMRNNPDNAELLTAAATAISSLATSSLENANKVDQLGGIQTVIDSLKKHPDYQGYAQVALDMVDQLAAIGFDTDKLVGMGAVEAILDAMTANVNVAEVQISGFKSLSSLLEKQSSDKSSNKSIKTAGLAILSHKNGISAMVNALEVHRSHDKVVKAGLETFAMLLRKESSATKQIAKSGAISAIVSAVYTQMLEALLGNIQAQGSMLGKFEQNLRFILESLVSSKEASALVKPVKAVAVDSQDQAELFESNLMSVAVFSKQPQLASEMSKAGIVSALTNSLDRVVSSKGLPHQSQVFCAFAVAISSFARSTSTAAEALSNERAGKIMIELVKKHTKLIDPSVATMRGMRVFATGKPHIRDTLVQDGVIEACAGAMRANNTDSKIALAAFDMFLSLASSDEACAAVTYSGGTRAAIKMIMDNSSSEEFEIATERALMVLERVISASKLKYDDICSNLKKQGAVEAAAKAMEMYPHSETIEALAARLLSRLMDAEGVAAEIAKMEALVQELKSSSKTTADKVLVKLAPSMATVGALALAPANIPIMQSKGAAAIIVDALKKIGTCNPTAEREMASRAGFRALGMIASTCGLPANLDAIELMLQTLRQSESQISLPEKVGVLNGIKLMAGNEQLAKKLVQNGAIETIVGLLKEYSHEDGIIIGCLGALAALTNIEDGVKVATKIGCVKVAMDTLKNHADTGSPEMAEEGMDLLANLALIDSNIPPMMNAGIIDLAINQLDVHCQDPQAPEPRVLNSAASLLGRIATTEATIKTIVKKNAVKKVIDVANSSIAYLTDPLCMEAVLYLIETCAMVKDTHEALVKSGAADLIMQAMNLNSTHENVVTTGSRALQQLLGSNSDTVKVVLQEINKLSSQLAKKPDDKETQLKLQSALRNLANLTAIDGVVTSKNAADVSKTAVDTMVVLDKSLAPGPMKQDLLRSAVQALGRTALLQPTKIDSDKAIHALLGVMENNRDDELLLESVIYALGNLATTPAAVKTIIDAGGIEMLQRTINASAENDKLRSAAETALEKIKRTAMDNAVEFSSDKKGTNALAELIKAHNNNPPAMIGLISAIGASKAGIKGLLGVLAADNFKDASPEAKLEVLRAMRSKLDQGGDKLQISSLDEMNALLSALGESPEGLSPADKKTLLERQKETMALLKHLTAGSSSAFLQADGVRKLLDALNAAQESGDTDLVRDILEVLNEMAQDKAVVNELVKQNAVDNIKAIMKSNPDDENINSQAIQILSKMAAAKGVGKVGMDADVMRLLNRTVNKFGNNKDIQKHGGKLVDGLSNIYREDGADMIGSRFDNLMAALSSTNFSNKAETADAMDSMMAFQKLTAAHKDNIGEVSPDALRKAVKFMNDHANEPEKITPLTQALAALATNEQNRNAIAEAGGLEAIVRALNGDNVDPAFLAAAIDLLNQFAKNDEFKNKIAQLGGIEAIIVLMVKFIDHQEVVDKCLSTLANLAYNSKVNVREVMKHKGPQAVQKVMSNYNNDEGILSLSMVLLSNLMVGEDENKLVIGQICGKEVVNVVRNNYENAKVFRGALRTLGNMAYLDENISWIVQNGATKSIVAGMSAHEKNMEIQRTAIDVIGNFASYDEDDPAIQKKIERGEQSSVYEIIVVEGGAKRILDTVKATEDPELMMSGLEALGNLSNSPVSVEKLIKMGIVETVFRAMKKYDWDEDMIERCVRLVAIMTYSQVGVDAIGERDGVQILLNTMESHDTQIPFLESVAAALKNLSSNEKLREQIGQLGGVKTVVGIYEKNLKSKELLLECIALFVRLTRSEEISEEIAQRGMNVLLKSIKENGNDTNFLVPIFTLIGHLAFAQNNLKIIVQYGGIDLIINNILDHPEDRNLVIRCIQTLDNIAMHSAEQSKIVIDAGGKATIEEVVGVYSGDKEVTQTGKSALLSMTQIDRRKAKPKYAFEQGGDSSFGSSTSDPLKNIRSMLKTGASFTEWSSGGPHMRHVYISNDWKYVCWKDPKKGVKSENKIALRDVRNVRSGLHDGHRKRTKTANPDLAFTVIGRATSLDLEAATVEDRERWIDALQVLINTYKTNPKWLK